MNKAQKAAAQHKAFKKLGFTDADQKDLDKFEKEKAANKAKTKALIATVVENYLVAHPDAANHKANVVKKIEDEQAYLHPEVFATRYAAYMTTQTKGNKMNAKLILTKEQAFFCTRMIKNAVENDVCWLRLEFGRSNTGRRQINFAYAYDTETKEETVHMETYNPYTEKGFVPEKEMYRTVAAFKQAYEVVPTMPDPRNDREPVGFENAKSVKIKSGKDAVKNEQLKAAKKVEANGGPLFNSEKKLIADAKAAGAKKAENKNKKLDI